MTARGKRRRSVAPGSGQSLFIALKGRNGFVLNRREQRQRQLERLSIFRPFRLDTRFEIIHGRRSFVACPWLSYFAPLALKAKEHIVWLNLGHY
jgi:hypothetical protein